MVSQYSGESFALENGGGHDWAKPLAIDHWGKITVPTLVIVGERDTSDNHDVADILERDIPNAKKVIIPAVGHIANMEAPDQFNKIVLSFFEDI